MKTIASILCLAFVPMYGATKNVVYVPKLPVLQPKDSACTSPDPVPLVWKLKDANHDAEFNEGSYTEYAKTRLEPFDVSRAYGVVDYPEDAPKGGMWNVDPRMIHRVDPNIDPGMIHNPSPSRIRESDQPERNGFNGPSLNLKLDSLFHGYKFSLPADSSARRWFQGDTLRLRLPEFHLDLPNPLIIPDPH